MLDKVLAALATNAKLAIAGVAGAALVAGGGAAAVTQVADTSPATTVTTAHSTSDTTVKDEGNSDTATAGIELPEQSHSPEATAEPSHPANHGACVSAIAKSLSETAGTHGKRGKLISAAARSFCGDKAAAAANDETSKASESSDAKDSPESTQPKDAAEGNSGNHHEAASAPEPTRRSDNAGTGSHEGSDQSGTRHSGGEDGTHSGH